MFREVVLDPMFREVGVETTTDLVVGLPEADVLIHIIMTLIHREDKIMTVGIPFQVEAEIMVDFQGAEVIITRAPVKHAIAVKNQGMLPTRAGKQLTFQVNNYPLKNPAVKLVRFLRQSQMTT